mmetsp:Transcript_9035/g.18263  ORF Transcript_9035/g.18263 Transcript_9035/m.18263 type:complete len:95 (-) Transcript_9035:318-602(-)
MRVKVTTLSRSSTFSRIFDANSPWPRLWRGPKEKSFQKPRPSYCETSISRGLPSSSDEIDSEFDFDLNIFNVQTERSALVVVKQNRALHEIGFE